MRDQSRTSTLFGDGGVNSNIEDLVKCDEALYDDKSSTLVPFSILARP